MKVFQRNRILIVFPLAYSDALELAIKSSEAIKLVDIRELKTGLKLHPMMSVNELNIIKSFLMIFSVIWKLLTNQWMRCFLNIHF